MMSHTISQIWLLFDSAKRWLRAIEKQGHRVFAAYDAATGLIQTIHARSLATRPALKAELANLRSDCCIEEHFFVIALGKAIESLKTVKGLSPSLDCAIDEFLAALPEQTARDVRNMYEHDLEYYQNNGRNQDRFFKSASDGSIPGINGDALVSATTTVGSDTDFLLGARLSMSGAIKAAATILPTVEKCAAEELEAAIARWRASVLPPTVISP